MKNFFYNNYFLIVGYPLLAILAFGKLFSTFFQQDEWAIYGYHLYWDKANLSWFQRLFTYEQYTHITPLSNLASYWENKIFGLNFSPYVYFSISIQLCNTFLVYCLVLLLLRKKIPAFVAGLIFLVDSIPSQAITWTATTMGTAGCVFFVLISLLFLTKYTFYQSKIIYLAMSILFALISIGFDEASIFIFLFIPLFWFICSSKRNYKSILKVLTPVLAVGGFYVFFRLVLMYHNFTQTMQPAGLTQPNPIVYVYRIFTHPLKAISQSMIHMDMIIKIADKLVLLGYPYFSPSGQVNPYISQIIGADIISYISAFAILLLCLWAYKLFKKNNKNIEANLILVSLLFISLSSLPFIFISGTAGYFSLFDGRHLYLTSIFKAILLANIFFVVYKEKRKLSAVLVVVLFLFLGMNVLKIRKDLDMQTALAFTRKSILSQVIKDYPKLPKKAIFYTESDTSYYGLPLTEPILPFQSGLGQTLLLWYYRRGENYPACFFKGEFLYQLTEEGYRECDGRGFGYFRKINDLKKAMKENKISKDQVIAFSYDSSDNTLSPLDLDKKLKGR